jgi:hypothetical protein
MNQTELVELRAELEKTSNKRPLIRKHFFQRLLMFGNCYLHIYSVNQLSLLIDTHFPSKFFI